MTKASWLIRVSFLCSLPLFSESPEQTLRTHYLPLFISDGTKESDHAWQIDKDKTEINLFDLLLPKATSQTSLSDHDFAEYLIRSFAPHFTASTLTFNADLPHHLQVFNVGNKQHFYQLLFPTQTRLGEVFGAYTLVSGATDNIKELIARRELLQHLVEVPATLKDLRTQIAKAKDAEIDVLDVLHPNGILSSSRFSRGFDNTKADHVEDETQAQARLGQIEVSSSWPLLTHPMRLPNLLASRYFVLASLGFSLYELRVIFSGFFSCQGFSCGGCLKGGCLRFATLIFGGFSAVGSYFFATNWYRDHQQLAVDNATLHRKLAALQTFLSALVSLDRNKLLPERLKVVVPKDKLASIESLYNQLATLKDVGDSTFFQANLVRGLIIAEHVKAVRPELEALLVHLGRIDFFTAVAHAVVTQRALSFAVFDQSDVPVFVTEGLINPSLLHETPQANSVQISGNQPNTIILTGPNASGKSTLMRAVATNVIYLAQTLGLSTSKYLRLTPVSAIHGFLESRDFAGKSSSYESDIERIADVLRVLRSLEPKQKSLFLVDEILSSTNAKEALIGSKEILKTLAEHKQGMTLVSTHLYGLSELGEKEPALFHNQHMELLRANGQAKVTYRLLEGKSTDNNALDIVAKEFAEFM